MTDLSHTGGDEAASSFLDGEATAEEIALIESDPALSARVAELRGAAELVATTVTVPTGELDRLRREVLIDTTHLDTTHLDTTHLGDVHTDDAHPGDAHNVIGLKPRDERRYERPQRIGRIAARAAALLVAGGVGFGVANLDNSDDETTATTGADAAMAESGDDIAQAEHAESEPPQSGPAQPDSLDSVSDADQAPEPEAPPTPAEVGDGTETELPAQDPQTGLTTATQPDIATGTQPGSPSERLTSERLTAAFDPFAGSLDPVADLGELAAVVRDRLIDYPGSFDESHDDRRSECLADLLDKSILKGAEQVDSTHGLVEGRRFIVVASRTSTGEVEAFAAPVDECEPVTTLFIGP